MLYLCDVVVVCEKYEKYMKNTFVFYFAEKNTYFYNPRLTPSYS